MAVWTPIMGTVRQSRSVQATPAQRRWLDGDRAHCEVRQAGSWARGASHLAVRRDHAVARRSAEHRLHHLLRALLLRERRSGSRCGVLDRQGGARQGLEDRGRRDLPVADPEGPVPCGPPAGGVAHRWGGHPPAGRARVQGDNRVRAGALSQGVPELRWERSSDLSQRSSPAPIGAPLLPSLTPLPAEYTEFPTIRLWDLHRPNSRTQERPGPFSPTRIPKPRFSKLSLSGFDNLTWPHRDRLTWPHPPPTVVFGGVRQRTRPQEPRRAPFGRRVGFWVGEITWPFGQPPPSGSGARGSS